MSENIAFKRLVESGQIAGEVVAVNRFIVSVYGLENVRSGSVVLFEDGTQGMVYGFREGSVKVLNLNTEEMRLGSLATIKSNELSIGVSKSMIGRVVSPLGQPIDGGKVLMPEHHQPIFAEPPTFIEREILDEQLETGVTLVDTLFPIVLGQRIAIMGDTKTGKTTFMSQLMINQAKKGKLIVYVMVGKRKLDLEILLSRIKKNKVENRVIIVMADVFDSLPMSYIAPYSGAAVAEYFWRNHDEDVVIIYDDLTNHAKAYRELSLLLRQNPGREAYPGDMFHTHSMLLERAGKIISNHRSLTVLPVSITYNDDITGYLSTSLISITDGQIIFDSDIADQGLRPAVNIGISVSRVGGRGQTDNARNIASQVSKQLAAYRNTKETSRFISEQSEQTRRILSMGDRINTVLKQPADELFTLIEQQIILRVALDSDPAQDLDIADLKKKVKNMPESKKTDKNLLSLAQSMTVKQKVTET